MVNPFHTLDNSPFDPVAQFPAFYHNPLINHLGRRRAWTISDINKRPINVQQMLTTATYGSPVIHGARIEDAATSLLTLDELRTQIPTAANNAFYLDAVQDGCLILDIEKTCPPEVAATLLTLSPTAFYTEVSMSGRGYHLVMPIPENFAAFPAVHNKPSIKHPKRWFEILTSQWITFTRQPIPEHVLHHSESANTSAVPWLNDQPLTWENVFADLAKTVAPNLKTGAGLTITPNALMPPDLSDAERIRDDEVIDSTCRLFAEHYSKTLADFYDDASRFEFSQIGVIINLLLPTMRMHPTTISLDKPINSDHIIRLLFAVATRMITHRSKHDEERSGVPYLMYQVISCLDMREHPDNGDYRFAPSRHSKNHYTHNPPNNIVHQQPQPQLSTADSPHHYRALPQENTVSEHSFKIYNPPAAPPLGGEK